MDVDAEELKTILIFCAPGLLLSLAAAMTYGLTLLPTSLSECRHLTAASKDLRPLAGGGICSGSPSQFADEVLPFVALFGRGVIGRPQTGHGFRIRCSIDIWISPPREFSAAGCAKTRDLQIFSATELPGLPPPAS